MLAGALLETEASSHTKLSVNSSDDSSTSRGLVRAVALSSFFLSVVCLESRSTSPSARLRFLLLHVFAGYGVESSTR